MRNLLRSRMIVGALLFAASLAGSAALPTIGLSQSGPESKRYIVLLKDGDVVDPGQRATEHGKAHRFKESHVYRHALRGYAAAMPPAAADAIRKHPNVLSVTEDGEVRIHARPVQPPPDQPPPEQPPQLPSNAILRIEGDESSTHSGDGSGSANVNVAVIDDGGPVQHIDLNVVGSTSCVSPGRPPRRTSRGIPFGSHGTMVGGFIGALDNEIGRVGVAPGARLWAVQALDSAGFGFDSEIICGLDWVVSTRTDTDPNNDIAVANMSLSGKMVGRPVSRGSCAENPDDPNSRAICATIASGVTIVASAGNEHKDFRDFWPVTFSEVLTVTAMADFDGEPGGLDVPVDCPLPVQDDEAAFFSDFATEPEDQLHTVAAPGVCIGSTYPGDQYAVSSGTSFSAPVVSGLVALCLENGQCAGLTPREIVAKIVEDAAMYNAENTGYGYEGDPLRPIKDKYYGYLPSASLY